MPDNAIHRTNNYPVVCLVNFYPLDSNLSDLVVRKMDNVIQRINHYPADSVVCFVYTYPLDSALSGG